MSEQIRKIVSKMDESKKEPLYRKLEALEDERLYSVSWEEFKGVEAAINEWEKMSGYGIEALENAKGYIIERLAEFNKKNEGVWKNKGPMSVGEYLEMKTVVAKKDPVFIDLSILVQELDEDVRYILENLADYLEHLTKIEIPRFQVSLPDKEKTEGLNEFQRTVYQRILDQNLPS